MYTGGCLCGAIRFEIRGSIRHIVFCHCSECRKAQGSAFASNGIVDVNDFKITAGQDRLTEYQVSPQQTKSFCQVCGSPILSQTTSRPGECRVRIGTIESDINETPEAHIFVGSKANWDTVCGDLPQYETWEPDR